ncbi:uncharacterized protein LOC132715003 isoform X2 [Ruditapes philippinarum]|uniref:uncharacterized protein LOC132715003 isoform X2 n=2 Tax=Ruditapes philippinarum TaxID=129788 RepID=UPI00295A598F|nr:uncharacterized protein LOC132715003 isoform X2 [Ruditapes philippinarum]
MVASSIVYKGGKMSRTPKKEPIGKHFKNGQRRHREHETESNTKQDCVADLTPALANSEPRNGHGQHILTQSVGATGMPVNTSPMAETSADIRQSGTMAEQTERQTASDAISIRGLAGTYVSSPSTIPDPIRLDEQFYLDMARIPVHLRSQFMFNLYHHQSVAPLQPIPEDQQYRIEQKKLLARTILTNISNEMDIEDKVVERILDSLEKLWY